MAAAEAEDTLQWVSLHEAAIRLAERSAADQKPLSAYAVEQRFRNDGYRYRYRDGSALHENDLSADFLREAVINVAASTATQGERTERIPNPDLPLVREGYTPQAQWVSRTHPFFPLDPFSRPYHIEKTIPAKTITDIEVLVPRTNEPLVVVPAVDPFRTGTAGRPTAKVVVLDEAKRRITSGEVMRQPGGLAHFARDLESWWAVEREKYKPAAPKLSANRIESIVRDIWRAGIPAK